MGKKLTNLFISLLLLSASMTVFAMSRINDGEARIWQEDNSICFGGTSYKTPEFFFARSIDIDHTTVVVTGISVFNDVEKKYWWLTETEAVQDSAGVVLKRSTCIRYGERLKGFKEQHPAKILENGMYDVFIHGHDEKTDNRARLQNKFCIHRIEGKPILKQAVFDKGISAWRCED